MGLTATSSTLTVSPAETRACPNTVLELTAQIEGPGVDGLDVRAQARGSGALPPSLEYHVTSRRRDWLTATVRLETGEVGSDYIIDISCIRGGEVLGVATSVIEVRSDIHLLPSTLEVDPTSLSGNVTVENCSNVTPEVSFRLVCQDGSLTLEASVEAEVCAFGRKVYDLQVADRSVDLGSCDLELVDDQGEVRDRKRIRNESRVRFAVPSRVPWFKRTWFRTGVAVVVVILVIGVPVISGFPDLGGGDDDDRGGTTPPVTNGGTSVDFSVGIDGEGIVRITSPGKDPVEIDRDTSFQLDEEATITLLAQPADRWEFSGWSNGERAPQISVTAADSGIRAIFEIPEQAEPITIDTFGTSNLIQSQDDDATCGHTISWSASGPGDTSVQLMQNSAVVKTTAAGENSYSQNFSAGPLAYRLRATSESTGQTVLSDTIDLNPICIRSFVAASCSESAPTTQFSWMIDGAASATLYIGELVQVTSFDPPPVYSREFSGSSSGDEVQLDVSPSTRWVLWVPFNTGRATVMAVYGPEQTEDRDCVE
jgi:hypothetical protein